MSDTDAVATRLTECFRLVFPFLQPAAVRTAAKAELTEWDSLAELSLITTIEEEFDIEFSDDAIDHLTSFDAALTYVSQAVPS